MPVLFGCNDTVRPVGTVDTLEGAYTAGAGTGISHRIPIIRVFESWSDVGSGGSFAAGTRPYKLFTAGHELIVSWKPPSSDATTKGYQKVTNGSQDTAINSLGDRIYALPFGAAVSGTQAGAGYGGNTPTKVRITFHHEMDNDTVYGTASEFKQAYRYFMARIKSRRPNLAAERVICLPIFTGQANNNGRASQFYPGNTDTDYCDEVGIDPYFVGQLATKTFDQRIAPWQKWRDDNAAGRKLCICETSGWDDSSVPHHVTYMGTIIAGILANSDVSAACWFSGAATSPSAIPKASNVTLWQAFKDAVDDAYDGSQPVDTTPPPPPLGLSATAVDSTTVTLSWQRPTAPDLAGYKISRDGAVIASGVLPSTLAYTVSGQTAGSSHAYRIAAYDKTSPPNQSAFVGPVGTSVPLTVTHPQPAEPDPPVVDPSTAVTVNGHDVALAAVVTDPAGGTLTVAVDWGDGNTGTGSNATHSYTNPGTYQVQVTVTSSVSSKVTATALSVVVEDVPDVDRTVGKVSLWLPKTGQPVGKFGPKLRENNNLITDSFEELYADRYVQNGDADPIPRLPVLSVTGGTFTDEDPSDDYPKGRTLLTVSGGGGGGVPADGSITPAKLSFDPATQAELDAGLALKADVGYSDTNKVTVGSVGRHTDSILHGWIGRSFDAAHIANTGGTTVDPGTVYWTAFVAEVSGAFTSAYVVVASAATGSGHTAKLHAANGSTVATATNATSRLSSTGAGALTFTTTSLTRGSVYYLALWTPSGAGGAAMRTAWLQGAITNVGLSVPALRAGSASAGSSPTTLPLGSGTAATPVFVGVK